MTYFINVYKLAPGKNFLGSHSPVGIPNKHALYRLRVTPKEGVTIRDVMGLPK